MPTFHRSNHRPQVLDLIWAANKMFSCHGLQVFYDILGPNVDHKLLTLCIGADSHAQLEHGHLARRYILSGSEEEEDFVFFIFEEMKSWTAADPAVCASQFIASCHQARDQFSKPGLAQYNCWWNEDCCQAKLQFEASPSWSMRSTFLHQCKLAKKVYFALKIEEMVKSRKLWEGTGWIKQRVLPKVPQIVDDGQVLNDLDHMFDKMHAQFAQSASTPAQSDFIDGLPQRPV